MENKDTAKKRQKTFGEKVSDGMASFAGSWSFIIFFVVALILWIIYNIEVTPPEIFDPYPFILLNLFLSCLAAIQAPVILMSQNRQSKKDRRQAYEHMDISYRIEKRLEKLLKKNEKKNEK
jgi:uncharacterized membrane protein